MKKKSNMLQIGIFLIFYHKKTHTNLILTFFERCSKPKKKNIHWLLVGKFFGPYQYTKFLLINYARYLGFLENTNILKNIEVFMI